VSGQNTGTLSMLVNQSKPVALYRAQDLSSEFMHQFMHALDGMAVTVSGTITSPDREPKILWKRSYPNRGEKSVSVKNVESIFSTNFPFSSDFAFTLFHSGSSWKAFQFAAAASRLGCSRM
jgi:hypothetical protein